jgi:alpha-1,2-mannosyltransferase
MWGVMLSTAASLAPADGGLLRISLATFPIAAAAIVGWPFSAILGVPLVIEQLFFRGTEKVEKGQSALWAMKRARNMFLAGLIGASLLVSRLTSPRVSE